MEKLCVYSEHDCPLLRLIGEYSSNRYILYLIAGVDTNLIKQPFTCEEMISKAENNDFTQIINIQLVITLCLTVGNISGLNNLRNLGIMFGERDMDVACYNCSLPSIKYLHSLGIKSFPDSATDIACVNKNLELMKWFRKTANRLPDTYKAYKIGDLDTIKWLKEEGILPDQICADEACYSDNPDLLDWIKEQGFEPSKNGLLLNAKKNGKLKLNTIKWINRNRDKEETKRDRKSILILSALIMLALILILFTTL
jgi:hypothetical protein